jgi:hypothetical protein
MPHEPRKATPPWRATKGAADEAPSDGLSSAILSPAADIADAYCVLAHTPYDRQRRCVFLSLHSAVQAVERSRKRGLPAQLILCRLVPVQADLELYGGDQQ